MRKIQGSTSELLVDLLDAVLYLNKKQVVAEGDVRLHPSESHMLMRAMAGLTYTEIAWHFAISKGAVSQVFARLEKKGVVVVTKDPARHNAASVTLTPLGEALVRRTLELRSDLAASLEGHLAGYTTAERATAHRFLGDLHDFVRASLLASDITRKVDGDE